VRTNEINNEKTAKPMKIEKKRKENTNQNKEREREREKGGKRG
jgi:hypothetical protein